MSKGWRGELGSAAEYHARRYGKLDQRLVHAFEARAVARLLAGLPGLPAAPVCLDVPSGYGRMSATLRAALDPAVLVGGDRRVERLKARRLEDRGAVVQLDLLGGLPFRAAAFDLVVSIRWFQHVREAEQRTRILRELLRVSRGYVLVSYYGAQGLHHQQQRLRRAIGRKARPLAMLAPGAFQEECRAAGATVIADRAVLPLLHAQRLALLAPAALSDP